MRVSPENRWFLRKTSAANALLPRVWGLAPLSVPLLLKPHLLLGRGAEFTDLGCRLEPKNSLSGQKMLSGILWLITWSLFGMLQCRMLR
jgi:hypothetical protein